MDSLFVCFFVCMLWAVYVVSEWLWPFKMLFYLLLYLLIGWPLLEKKDKYSKLSIEKQRKEKPKCGPRVTLLFAII